MGKSWMSYVSSGVKAVTKAAPKVQKVYKAAKQKQAEDRLFTATAVPGALQSQLSAFRPPAQAAPTKPFSQELPASLSSSFSLPKPTLQAFNTTPALFNQPANTQISQQSDLRKKNERIKQLETAGKKRGYQTQSEANEYMQLTGKMLELAEEPRPNNFEKLDTAQKFQWYAQKSQEKTVNKSPFSQFGETIKDIKSTATKYSNRLERIEQLKKKGSLSPEEAQEYSGLTGKPMPSKGQVVGQGELKTLQPGGKKYDELNKQDKHTLLVRELKEAYEKDGVDGVFSKYRKVFNVAGGNMREFGEQRHAEGQIIAELLEGAPSKRFGADASYVERKILGDLSQEGSIESRIVRAVTGATTTPFIMTGTGLESISKDRVVHGMGEAAMGIGSFSPFGAAFNAALSQPEIQPVAEGAFGLLQNAKDSINSLPFLKDSPQEVKDAIGLAVDAVAFKLLHSTGRRVFKGTRTFDVEHPVTGELMTVKLPGDRNFWADFKNKMSSEFSGLLKDPVKFVNTHQVGMSVKYVDGKVIAEPRALPSKEVRSYIDTTVKLREQTRKMGEKTFKQQWDEVQDWVGGAHSWLSPIMRRLEGAEGKAKKGVLSASMKFKAQARDTYVSDSMAKAFMDRTGFSSIVQSLKPKQWDDFSEFMIAKHNLDVFNRTGQNYGSRSLTLDQRLVKEMTPLYENFSNQYKVFKDKSLDYAVERELISPEFRAMLKEAYPEHVPMNRVFDLIEKGEFGGKGTPNIVGLSKQSIIQKIEGSTRPIENIFTSTLKRTLTMFKEGEVNMTSKRLVETKDIPGNPLSIRPIQTAAVTMERINILTKLKDLYKKEREDFKLRKSEKQKASEAKRQIETKTFDDFRLNEVSNNLYKTATDAERFMQEALIKAADFADDAIINKLLQQSLKTENQVAKLEMRANELSQRIGAKRGDQVALKKELEDVIGAIQSQIKARRTNISELRESLKELPSYEKAGIGEGTLPLLNKGVKEVWAIDPVVGKFLQGAYSSKQMGKISRFFTIPMRIAKEGITGLELSFAVRNPVRDFRDSLVKSKYSMVDFTQGLGEFHKAMISVTRGDKRHRELIEKGVFTTRFDITRDQGMVNLKKIASEKNIGTRVQHTLKRPEELLRVAEDFISITEKGIRQALYEIAYKAERKAGMNHKDAEVVAKQAARETTADFMDTGSIKDKLGWISMYGQAAIAGNRVLYRALRDRPVKTLATMAAVNYVPQMLQVMWNMSDPERAEIYAKIQDWEKEINDIIILPGAYWNDDEKYFEGVIKIPKPPGINMLTEPVRGYTESLFGLDAPTATEIASDVLAAFSPIDPAKPVAGAEPITKTGLELYFNQDAHTGQDIPLTSRSATINKISEATKYLGLTPGQTEKIMKNFTGKLGQEALHEVDMAAHRAGMIPESQVGGVSVVKAVQRSFYGARGEQDVQDLYTKKKEIEDEKKRADSEIKSKMKGFVDDKDFEGAKEYAAGLPEDRRDYATKRFFEEVEKKEKGNLQYAQENLDANEALQYWKNDIDEAIANKDFEAIQKIAGMYKEGSRANEVLGQYYTEALKVAGY